MITLSPDTPPPPDQPPDPTLSDQPAAILKALSALNPHTRAEIIARGHLTPQCWKRASIVQLDVCSFTRRSSQITSAQVLDFLQRLFQGLDDLLEIHDLKKIDVQGDCFIAIAYSADHQVNAVRFCLHAIEVAKTTPVTMIEGDVMNIRTAVHSGIVDAIVLDTVPWKYTLVGKTFATVKELETTGMAGKVHCSQTTVDALAHLRSLLLIELGPEICGGESAFFVSARKDKTVSDDETVLCPKTLHFSSVSKRMAKLFDYNDVKELRSFRMLQVISSYTNSRTYTTHVQTRY